MNKWQFKKVVDFLDPLICVQGDIFETPADHIAFAVHYPNSKGEYQNSGGFAGMVCERAWPELQYIKFEKGETRSHVHGGKTYHAMAVHCNEPGGWDEAPELIEMCLNKIPVDSNEVIATVLIGGGKAGQKWKANPRNIMGMSRSYKTVVLYVTELSYVRVLAAMGLVCPSLTMHQKLELTDESYGVLAA